ncbi:hypothetical protein WR25_21461 [Diploscapter pachys]|uniref:Uncharacterized protein n=1 Tax=Diploscapter pachys TaxID=2018661 RepID=A0A2A2JEQ6_9BILA|nr:hypothetical protein WR25_21461 [Diploscapter pachys]
MPLQIGDEPPVVQSTSLQIQKADDDKKDPNEEWSVRLVDQLIADYNNSDKKDTHSLPIFTVNVELDKKEKNKHTSARIVDDIIDNLQAKKEDKEKRKKDQSKYPEVVFNSEKLKDAPSSSSSSKENIKKERERVIKKEADSSSSEYRPLKDADKIAQDLLNDFLNNKKTFSLEDMIEDIEESRGIKKKKKHKEHKEKKSKKKHKHRSKSRERDRDRDKDRDRNRERRRKSRSKSRRNSDRTPSPSSSPLRSRYSRSRNKKYSERDEKDGEKEGLEIFNKPAKPPKSNTEQGEVNSDDDLPLGADFMTVTQSTSSNEKISINLPIRRNQLDDEPAFPLSKNTAAIPGDKEEANRESASLLPRNVALKNVPKEKVENKAEAEVKQEKKIKMEVDDNENIPLPGESSGKERKRKKKKDKDKDKDGDESSKKKKDKKKEKRKRKRSSSSSASSRDGQHTLKEDVKPGPSSQPKRVLTDRWCAVITNMVKPRKSQSPSKKHNASTRRRESRSRSRSRGRRSPMDRSRARRRRSSSIERRKRRRSTSWDRRRRNDIDKDYLLKVAKKNARMMGLEDKRNVDDFVTYCQKIQKRQDKEKRRSRGETVSSDSDDSWEEHNIKHPYAIPRAEPIKINIVTASGGTGQLALPSSEIVDEAELRVVFPVSSGVVHKENAEWTPVVKDKNSCRDLVPISCQSSQKKKVAMTSKEAQRAIENGLLKEIPAPAPPLSCFIPPPPPPPKFLPEPESMEPVELPPVLYVPPEEQLIIKEPDFYKDKLPKDLPQVLAQRAKAMKRLEIDPNDYEARRELRESDEQVGDLKKKSNFHE